MYCSLEEAWPNYSKPKNIIERYSEKEQENIKNIEPIESSSNHQANLSETHLKNNCDDILAHIQKCDYCMKEIYKRYNCNNMNINMLASLSKEQKDIISIILIGLLVLLVLQLFKND